jgi:hypothetical protein
MKNLKTFEEFLLESENIGDEIVVLKEGFLEKTSEAFQYHVNNKLSLSNTIFRTGSEAYKNLFEEAKTYWDSGNVILKGKSGWMSKNLEVGKKAMYKTEDGKMIEVELDTPARGGEKKYYVYHNSGKTTDDGEIIATRIEWGNPGMPIKNDDPGAASSFWARQQCDLKKKMDPSTAGFWACYAPSLFSQELSLSSDAPW